MDNPQLKDPKLQQISDKIDRMEAKFKKVSQLTGPKPTTSFAQAMSNAQLNALKPYIQQEMVRVGSLISQKVSQHVANTIMQAFADLQTHVLAIENVLKAALPAITDDTINSAIFDIEDAAEQLKPGAEVLAGATVRVNLFPEGSSVVERFRFSQVGDNSDKKMPWLRDAESAMLGKKVGDTVEFAVTPEGKDGASPAKWKVTILRISNPEITEGTK